MTYFGALINVAASQNYIAECVAAVNDLGLNFVVLGVVPSVYPWSMYDAWYEALPPQQIIMMLSLPTGTAWTSISTTEFASQAATMAQNYPNVARFLCINEPNVTGYYPPSGISPETYMDYFNAMQWAILKQRGLTGEGQGKGITSGPQTSGLLQSYWGLLAAGYDLICFHPYGSSTDPSDSNYVGNTVKPLQQNGYSYACSEWTTGPGSAPSVWQACMDTGFEYAIFYELQSSPDTPNAGLLDSSGNPVQPYYDDAKNWLGPYRRQI
jgi:hypothetical protein